MNCLRNHAHKKTGEVCEDCLKELGGPLFFPDLNLVNPELRPLITRLTLQYRDFSTCWRSSYEKLTVYGKRLPIKNVYYAFFKADIGKSVLKNTCRKPYCVNPAHLISRFEKPQIVKKVRSGFNRKFTDMTELSDAEWLRHP